MTIFHAASESTPPIYVEAERVDRSPLNFETNASLKIPPLCTSA